MLWWIHYLMCHKLTVIIWKACNKERLLFTIYFLLISHLTLSPFTSCIYRKESVKHRIYTVPHGHCRFICCCEKESRCRVNSDTFRQTQKRTFCIITSRNYKQRCICQHWRSRWPVEGASCDQLGSSTARRVQQTCFIVPTFQIHWSWRLIKSAWLAVANTLSRRIRQYSTACRCTEWQ